MLVKLAKGEIKRLIVTMPPRHGKSQLCSRYLPAWFLGMWPNKRVILCSYEANFAADWGGKARDLLIEHGQRLFGVAVRDNAMARNEWRTDKTDEGGMMTAGVGGPITGKGASLLIIDDPVKNAEEANSPTYRAKTWDWWQSTAYTRLDPDGVALIVQTRWHEDDLTGRLLQQDANDDSDEPDEKWHVLNLPAIAEENDQLGRKPGEALWPERWGLDRLLRRMKRLGGYVWSALFQQRPTAVEGDYFKRAWFVGQVVEPGMVPPLMRVARAWDFAATEAKPGTDPDFTSPCKMGMSGAGVYYVLESEKYKLSASDVEARVASKARVDGRDVQIRIEQEPGSSGKALIDHYRRNIVPGYDCRGVVSRGDKVTRAQTFNAACERGDVYFVRGAWNQSLIDSLCEFPRGKHDDDVDSAVSAYNHLSGRSEEPWSASDLLVIFDPPEPNPDSVQSLLMSRIQEKRLADLEHR